MIHSVQDLVDVRDFIDVHNVRIRPSKILFQNAYEGRSYKTKITIQNIGPVKVLIQIDPPSSYAFTIKSMARPEALSPGLTINRTVQYTYSHAYVTVCQIPIHIDKDLYDLTISVEVLVSDVSISPDIIDFGTVDIGLTSSLRVLRITNDGNIASNFYIDIPKGKPRLIVDPIRGQVLAKSFIDVNIKLVSCEAQCLKAEIWIKCDRPMRIPVRGEVIVSKLESIHPTATESFTLIDFPPTYIGVKNNKYLLVRNYSSVSNMFCVMGEIRQKSTPLDKCTEALFYHDYFRVYPTEGRFEPGETKLFQFAFTPKKRRGPDANNYYVCAFLIHRVRCQDVNPEKYPEGIFTNPKLLKNIESIESVNQTGEALYRNLSPLRQDTEIYFKPKSTLEPNFLRIFVHGIPEEPSVRVTPTDLVMNNLTIGVKETRVLELRNVSKKLPIILQYRKVAFIEAEKDTIFLQPKATTQLSVYITPFKCGPVSTKIVFNLLFYDCPKTNEDKYSIIGHVSVPVRFDTAGLTKYPKPELNPGLDPKYIRSVGVYCHGVQFNTPLKNTKCITVDSKISGPRTALVAFPNDTQQSLRPWRSNIECRTIFSNYPRYIPPLDTSYEVTVTDKRFKQDLDIFYSNFIRAEAERLRQMSIKEVDAVTEYTLTIGSKLLCTEPKNKIDCAFKFAVSNALHYISLTPAEMNNISIVPTLIETGCIAANHPHNFNIWITNSNEFAIHIFVRPDKPSLMFPQGDRFMVKENSEIPIPVTYVSNHIGYYILSLDILTNDSMIMTVAVLANVVPSTLSLMDNEVIFKNDITYSYFDLKNDLNVPISFEWNFEDENYSVSPRRGVVPEKWVITCIIKYLPYIEGNLATDFILRTDGVNNQSVKIVSTIIPSDVVILTPAIMFEDLPLNLPDIKHFSLENRHSFPVGFQVLDCGLGDVILFAPTTGVIPPHCQTSIIIRIQMPHCVSFETKLRLRIINADIIEIPIIGNVVYPDISIEPKVIQFKKIVATTTEHMQVTVTNKSVVRATVSFKNEATDFKISEGEFYWSPASRGVYPLEKDESMSFYVHFLPLEMTSMTFYLPIIINGIIGPPRMYDPLSTRCQYYLPECPPLCKPAPMPMQLPLVKIVGFAMEPKIRLSKLVLEFFRSPQSPQMSRDTNKVIFTNNQAITENILFRTDHIMYPFLIDRIDAAEVSYLEKAIVIKIPPKANAVVTFSFNPRDFCKAESFAPFYLKSESTMNSHAVLYLTGHYKEPTIMGERTIFYSRPYPLQYKAISSKVIKFQNHFKECTVFTYTDLPELQIQLLYSTHTQTSDTEYEMECVFKTMFPNNIQFCNIIKLYCSCGSVWQSNIIGCAENCLLTNYAFAETFLPNNIESHVTRQKSTLLGAKASTMSMFDDVSRKIFIEEEYHTSTFFTSYPLFPLDDMFETQNYIDEKLSTFLLGVVEAVETWFFTQAMFGTVYYVIPLGINSVVIPQSEDDVTKKKKVRYCEVPFINGLINLVGPQFKTLLPPRPTLDTPVAEVNFIYEIYACVIKFLKELGAYFTYLQPEFLMPYTKFEIYKRCIYPNQAEKSPITMKIKTITIFYYLSKQSWCDVLLQTYKVLYLFRLHVQSISKYSESAIQLSPMKQYRSSVKNLARNCNIFSNSELFLVNWLEYHYNTSKHELWSGQCYLQKEVNFFGKDLRDGLVFAAVTATYCPYLTKYYKKMYTNPVGRDQLFHNNMIVIKCWDMLKYTYRVSPEDLINPNCIKMLMLVAYLYDVLPFMHPTDEILFEAKLSKKTYAKIKLHNINDFTIAYQPIKFNDTEGVLHIPSEQLVIPAKGTKTLTITYHAKYARPVQAYVLLNGECKGFHYAKCKCLTLVASPDITYATSTFKVAFPLYSFHQLTLTVQSPYKRQATYSIKLLSDYQLTFEELEQVNFIPPYNPPLPFHRVGFIDYEFRTDSTGVGTMEIAVCFGYFQRYEHFVYFSNPRQGDFIIKLDTVPTPPKLRQELKVMVLKKSLRTSVQNVDGIFVHVPCKNYPLWSAFSQYLVELSIGDEKLFWQKNMRSSIGIHLIQKLCTQDVITKRTLRGLYYHKKIFVVTMVDNKDTISLPTEVTIEDDWSSGIVKLPVTILSTCSELPKTFSFKMASTDGTAIRHYVCEFVFVDTEEEFCNNISVIPVIR